ncbi:alpha/beta hydrolase [Puniceicoccales bacterium CK1056]|uniref:Alpha/beta hydrolase n=1 Tax=Oceanipulchritudo coccoides TaxID=2706888 RepID=A0A6B2LY27_9BACT|nr:alpha/beta hydrolase [Oceanipulchritudo coccoides]NDV61518.1 alpha/beta hydrolase [Oceanipulchritudo coccoides]
MPRYTVLIITFCLHCASVAELPYGPIRAAYEFTYGDAYSAAVELPAYRIVDLGAGITPVSINDSMMILMSTDDKKLIQWGGGERSIMNDNFRYSDWARLNEEKSVVTTSMTPENEFEMRFWLEGDASHCLVENEDCLPYPPYYWWPYAFNDQDQLVLHQEAESGFFAFAPYTLRIETDLLNLRSGTCEELSSYEYYIDENYDLHQGGILYTVNDINNYGETVGEVYSDSAFSDDSGITYYHQDQYFALNKETVLDFEPLQITDMGTVLGRSLGPQFGLVILDQFGQRSIGPVLTELESVVPCISNPLDGLEEIVIENHYWKRMSETDFSGRPTGQPSPDFWEGSIDNLIMDTGSWAQLKATCISASGRIAGTGRFFDWATFQWEDRGFLLMPQLLVPDWDRNGTIDITDQKQAAKNFPWYFWVNDDDDSGDLARSWADDMPESADADWESPGVDGLRDVVDFFPVHLDIQDFLAAVENIDDVEVSLSQADAALNFVYTSLLPEEMGKIHESRLETGFGPLFSSPLESAEVQAISSQATILSAAFIRRIRDENRGVLLMEGAHPSTEPLVMNYHYRGDLVFSCELPLSISPVGEMFRVANLRNVDPKFSQADPGPWPTDLGEPPNLPDAYLRSFKDSLPTLVHIHGYNWGGDQAPAAHAEIFKRFFQTGSCARYVGVTWFGDEGTLELIGTSFDYNENVINAFITAGYLPEALATLAAPLTSVFAHSLGNMVASSAIVDHGWNVLNYFMLNAAVPTEAYLGEQEDRRKMVNPDWKDEGSDQSDYPEFLMPSYWSALFQPDDHRSLLSWKTRFGGVSGNTICHNFFSTGEDILRSGNGDLPALFEDIWKTELIWVYNEMVKGTSTLATSLTGDVHGGWGFNFSHMDWINPGGAAHPPAGEWIRMLPAEAALIDPEELITEPFFRPFSSGDSDFPDWSDGSWLYGNKEEANAHLPPASFVGASPNAIKNHAKILAEGLPAHSAPAGSNSLPKLPLLLNYDLDKVIRQALFWPFRSPAEKQDRWLHSDYLNPALPFVAELYRICVKSINP